MADAVHAFDQWIAFAPRVTLGDVPGDRVEPARDGRSREGRIHSGVDRYQGTPRGSVRSGPDHASVVKSGCSRSTSVRWPTPRMRDAQWRMDRGKAAAENRDRATGADPTVLHNPVSPSPGETGRGGVAAMPLSCGATAACTSAES